jgi:hypothetical protein
MNRDELHSRAAALRPRILDADGIEAIYPREPGGGTWIACNDTGNVLALLNWHVPISGDAIATPRTRGSVIPRLISCRTSREALARLKSADLASLLPFRLIGVFPSEGIVREWRWAGWNLTDVDHPWARRHWFSSSISDARATEERLRVIESAASPSSPLDETWVRGTHSSHSPAPGPFSVCVHRPDASTVSYTVVRCGDGSISMEYLEGSPCLRAGFDALVTVGLRAGRMKIAGV